MRIQAFFTIKQKSIANGNPVNSELEDGNGFYDGSYDDPSVPLLGQGKAEQTGVALICHGTILLLLAAHTCTHTHIHTILVLGTLGYGHPE